MGGIEVDLTGVELEKCARILGIGANHFKNFNFILRFLLLANSLARVQRNFELWRASSFRG